MIDSSALPPVPPPLVPKPPRRRFATVRAIIALMLREMSTTYGRSPGGYLWAILEPAAGIMLLTLIFSLGFRSPPIGSNFAIFYATGLIPFFMFTDISGKVAQSVLFSRALLAYPSVTFVDAIIGRFLVNLLTQIMVAYVVFTFILLTNDTRTIMQVEGMMLSFAMAAATGVGVGVANCFLFSMFPLWMRVWSILTRPLFLISGIIFIMERVPEPYRSWLLWNPLVHVTASMRAAFYPGYDAPYVDPLYVFGLSGIVTVFGLIFLFRYHRTIVNF